MLQESASTAWDMRNITAEPSVSEKLLLLYLLVVCAVAITKITRVWRPALPFTLTHFRADIAYLHLLKSSAGSLQQWLGLTLLNWAIFLSLTVYRLCNIMLDEGRVGALVAVFQIREFSMMFSLTLLIGLFVFLARWHFLNRLAKLSDTASHHDPKGATSAD